MGNWLVTDEFLESLFKPEFIGFRLIALTAKCCFVEGKNETKFSCKGMLRKWNEMTWGRYIAALEGKLDTGKKHAGFRILKRYGDI